MATLVAEQVAVSFGVPPTRVRTLSDVSVSFRSGEMTLVRGPSGSGKSTLLAVLGGLLTADEGRVLLDGVCVSALDDRARAHVRMTRIGFVFQTFQLFDTMTALENVALPLHMLGVRGAVAMRRATDLLDTFEVGHRAGLRPKQMSGGEQQRVALARALSTDPSVILADEPTAALDGQTGAVVAAMLQRAARELGKLVVTISHDERLFPFADRVVTLSDGRIVSDRRPA